MGAVSGMGRHSEAIHQEDQSPKMPDLPDHLILQLIQTLMVFPNDTTDFSGFQVRKSMINIYPLFIVMYLLTIICGCIGNVIMTLKIFSILFQFNDRSRDETWYVFLANAACLNVLTTSFVMPVSLATLLIQNWVFGRSMCYMAPLIQDVPLYGSLTSLTCCVVFRYHSTLHRIEASAPGQQRPQLPGPTSWRKKLTSVVTRRTVTLLILSWLFVTCLVAPQAAFIQFYDLQVYLGPQFSGVVLCTVVRSAGLRRYSAALFVVMYLLPLAVSSYMHLKTYRLLRSEGPEKKSDSGVWTSKGTIRMNSPPTNDTAAEESEAQYEEPDYEFAGEPQQSSSGLQLGAKKKNGYKEEDGKDCRSPSPVYEEVSPKHTRPLAVLLATDALSLDPLRIQLCLAAATLGYGLLLAPLMVLRLVQSVGGDTLSPEQLDVTMVWLVWLALLQTVTTPVFFMLGHLQARKTANISPGDMMMQLPYKFEDTQSLKSVQSCRTPNPNQSLPHSGSVHESIHSMSRASATFSHTMETAKCESPEHPPLPTRPPPLHLPLLSNSRSSLLEITQTNSFDSNVTLRPSNLSGKTSRSQIPRHHSLNSPRSNLPRAVPTTPPNSPFYDESSPTKSYPSHTPVPKLSPFHAPSSRHIPRGPASPYAKSPIERSPHYSTRSPIPMTHFPFPHNSHRSRETHSLRQGHGPISSPGFATATPTRSRTIHRITNDRAN